MRIGCLLEPKNETRVAITPHSAKHFIQLGFEVGVEKNAGLAAGFNDSAYQAVGVQIIDSAKKLLNQSQILLCLDEPPVKTLSAGLAKDSLIIGSIDKDPESTLLQYCKKQHLSLFSMNLIPRISRAQSMDSLSSQANLAGYRAVIEATANFHSLIPMMMTAAGMIQPATVLILGAGVAGLQAIATAKRLGAVVYAFDVRRAAKEQVESLGAEFVEVDIAEDAQTQSGYATESSETYKKLQAELIDNFARKADIIISTALIPGRKAPILLFKETIHQMKSGSVVVDMATSKGGNCELSQMDKTIKVGEVTIIGTSNLARLVPTTASTLYANNLVHLIDLLANKTASLTFNPEDDIVQQALLYHQGHYMPFEKAKEKTSA